MRYTHLSQDERYQIYALRLEKKTPHDFTAAKEVARRLDELEKQGRLDRTQARHV